MRIKGDRERCIGAGMCALTAPEVFDQSPEDGRVLVLTDDPAALGTEAVRRAVFLCPADALELVEGPQGRDGIK